MAVVVASLLTILIILATVRIPASRGSSGAWGAGDSVHVHLVIVSYTHHITDQSGLGSCAAPATAASSAAETTAAAGTAAALRQTDDCDRQSIVLEVS